jgi:uncharacterized membrane-anchored protein
MVLAALVAVTAALLVSNVGGAFGVLISDAWSEVVSWIKGLT